MTAYSATGLSSSTTYYYRVRAINANGNSANTSTASATTQTQGTVPAAPSGLTATVASTSQINLGWTNNATNQTGFQIDQATSADFTQGLTTVAVARTCPPTRATGLSSSTTYYYRVRAINANGNSANTSTASATTASAGVPVAVPVPDGSFTDAAAYYINSNTGGGLTFTAPMTGTLSGWNISATPSTARGGFYSGWEPYGAVDSVTSGSGASPFTNNAPWVGNQPSSSYQAFVYNPGEQYDYDDVVGGAQPGASLKMTTTGINLAAVAGSSYTATIEYANVSWSSCAVNASANVALNILAGGVVVGTGTLSGLAQNSPWTPVTATWTASSAYAGQPIQLQVVATNFLEGPGSYQQWQVPSFGFTDATLTATAVSGVPAAPSGLTATAASSSQINLSWTNNANNQTGFQIDQATSSDFTQGLTTVTVGANVTTYSATGLSASTTYYYRVRAINSSGDSANTSTASATTQAQGTIPVAPSGLAATAASSSEIDLSWTNNATNQSGFQIDQATSSDFTQGLITATVGANVTSYSATGLSASTTYYYRVRATNSSGDSANTSTASATTQAQSNTPAAPSSLIATTVSSNEIDLSWTNNASNQTGFQIDQATNSAFTTGLTTVTAGANVNTYSASGLSSGTTYYYRVRATYTSGNSANTSTAIATTDTTSTTLTILNANFDDLLAGDGDDRNAEHQGYPYPALSQASWWGIWSNTGGVQPWWGRWNPTDTQFAGTTDTLVFPNIIRGPLPAPAIGTQYAFVTPITDGGTGSLATVWSVNTERFCIQNPDGSTADVEAGQHYVASMAVGRPLDTSCPDYTLEIVTEDTTTGDILQVLSSSTVTQANVPLGGFYLLTTSYNAPASGGPIGQMLALNIICNNFYETNGVGTVGVFVNAGLTVSPEPIGTPAAPSGLTATAASSSQINLSWTNNATDQTGFTIDQATSSDFSTGLTTETVGANVTTYSATGLSAGTTYYYRVRATNANGDSTNTSTASATTQVQSSLPAAPSGLTATAASSSQINLNWTNNATNQTGFQIDQATSSDFTQGLTTVTVGSGMTSYSATSLSAGTTYYYRIRATNANGDSANTSTVSATTQSTIPAVPNSLAATAASSSQINLSWVYNSINETGFQIDQATSSDFTQGLTTVTVGANMTSYIATGLSASTTYYYRVRAINSSGDSANTSTASATTTAAGVLVAVPVPDGSFASDAAAYYINSNTGGGLTFTSPMTATLSGWTITATPSTANGGVYSAWEPYAAVDTVTSGSGATPFANNAPWVGNQPGSSYEVIMYYPGELYNYGSVVGGSTGGNFHYDDDRD